MGPSSPPSGPCRGRSRARGPPPGHSGRLSGPTGGRIGAPSCRSGAGGLTGGGALAILEGYDLPGPRGAAADGDRRTSATLGAAVHATKGASRHPRRQPWRSGPSAAPAPPGSSGPTDPRARPARHGGINHDRQSRPRCPRHGRPPSPGAQRDRLRRRRPRARRVRPQGDPARRARDARPDGAAPRVRRGPAAARRPRRRLAAHDRADRRADRDAGQPRRRGALGVVQHLLHPGPRRRRDRRRPARHPGGAARASRCSPGRARRWTSTGGPPSSCSSSATRPARSSART